MPCNHVVLKFSDLRVLFNEKIVYKETQLDLGFRIDILVEDKVIIELKSIETILDVHHKQVLTYLKLIRLRLALLINFNTNEISKAIHRKVNNL